MGGYASCLCLLQRGDIDAQLRPSAACTQPNRLAAVAATVREAQVVAIPRVAALPALDHVIYRACHGFVVRQHLVNPVPAQPAVGLLAVDLRAQLTPPMSGSTGSPVGQCAAVA